MWKIEPKLDRVVNGLPGRVDRLKGLGNSIVPQIAEYLFNLIKMKELFQEIIESEGW
jgi:DNA (cytosine-5)-methyltransferase 1